MPQYKPGEVEIVRKVLEEIVSIYDMNGASNFAMCLRNKIKSLEPVKEKWKPKVGDTFWVLDSDAQPIKQTWRNHSSDYKWFKIGNCFPDKASCEVAAAKFIKMLEG